MSAGSSTEQSADGPIQLPGADKLIELIAVLLLGLLPACSQQPAAQTNESMSG